MKRVKITTSNAELEEFLARTGIEIINVDVRSCYKMAIKIIKEGKKELNIYKVTCEVSMCI